jgi:hypothetical protein
MALLASAVLVSNDAEASVRLGIGGDYWAGNGIFSVLVGVDTPLARHVVVGGRFGGLITGGGYTFGAPIDVFLRVNMARHRVYLEGMFGPWFLFGGAGPLRLHGAIGFGLQSQTVGLGLELGFLDPAPMGGIRLSFKI